MNADAARMLTHYDRATREVGEATTLAAAKDYRDKAQAVRAYARLAKDDELISRATELKLRAERRMGELLREMETRGEIATQAKGRPQKRSDTTTLKALGVSRDESSRAKRLAEPSKQDFDRVVKAARVAGDLTRAAAVKHVTKRVATAKASRGAWPFRGVWTNAQIDEAEDFFTTVPRGQELKACMAEAGAPTTHVLKAARYTRDASPAYQRAAVRLMLSENGRASAAMLYGATPPATSDHLLLVDWLGRLPATSHKPHMCAVRAALTKALAAERDAQIEEEQRWKTLYSPTDRP